MSKWRDWPQQFGARGFALMVPRAFSRVVQQRIVRRPICQQIRTHSSLLPKAPSTPATAASASSRALRQELAIVALQTSVLVKMPANTHDKRELSRDLYRYRKSVLTQCEIARYTAAVRGRDPGDWREILQMLLSATPARSTWRAVVVEVDLSDFPVAELYGDESTSARSISRRTGCVVWADRRDEGPTTDDPQRPSTLTIVVYGPEQSIRAAVSDLLQTTKHATIKSAPAELGLMAETKADVENETREAFLVGFKLPERFDEPVTARLLDVEGWADYEPDPWLQSAPQKPFAMLKPPASWSYQSFDRYVKNVIRSEPGRNHTEQVVRTLVRLFYDPVTSAVASESALHAALLWLASYGRTFWSEIQTLCSVMERHPRVVFGTEHYNCMMRAAANAKNLPLFAGTLLRMLERGHLPAHRTWLNFAYIIENHDVRVRILQAMLSKGMLTSPTATRHIAGVMAPKDVARALDRGASGLPTILASLDQMYGSRDGWLTRTTGNKIIDVLCTYALNDEAFALLDEMSTPGRPKYMWPDLISYNTICTHAAVQAGKIRYSLAALKCLKSAKIRPDVVTFDALFETFWQRRWPLCTAIIWHFAALNGAHNYRMRSRVITAIKARKMELSGQAPSGAREWVEQQRKYFGVTSALYRDIAPEVQIARGDGHVNARDLVLRKLDGVLPVDSLFDILRQAVELDRQKYAEIREWKVRNAKGKRKPKVAQDIWANLPIPAIDEESDPGIDERHDPADTGARTVTRRPAKAREDMRLRSSAPSPFLDSPFVIRLRPTTRASDADTAGDSSVTNMATHRSGLEIMLYPNYSASSTSAAADII